jgi:hypothetical protein
MNEETEQFEQRLKRQPLRQVPAAWREEILAVAVRHSSYSCGEIRSSSFFAILNRRLVSWFWPHPAAWGGLAAIWIFIFAVHFSIRDQTPILAEKVSPPSPEVIAELRQQQRLFAELIGPNDSDAADRPKTFAPRPRSERIEFLTV